ncbi:MAG: 2,3-bisphosphoglycerate-independent phosphoglycerate mutase [Leptospira sp.]|nr:2,3-bisphosphoglycerate-independent phosphoglycerate mutase [Leptospira sp.]NCS92427.1 2,3-bisphosphoglycerate-independent phosphoglycerate mutase [Leptospira sp.]
MLSLHKKQNSNPQIVLLVVLDGVGSAPTTVEQGNAIQGAKLPNLNRLWSEFPTVSLQAHGKAVGMPSDEDMGNSEVGHNVLGCGRIYDQGAKLVSNSIESGEIFGGKTWTNLIQNVLNKQSTLHFLGLLSDGNVHAHIHHLEKMLEHAVKDGVKKIRIHILLDGRDVPEKSALEYVLRLEEKLTKLRSDGIDAEIASGGGRMTITMDRYEADWSMVERGWKVHVLGEGRMFKSTQEAIETFRKEDPAIIDQYLPSFVIEKEGKPVGSIKDDDSVIFFNFRGDRAIEISRAFTEEDFSIFDRIRSPKIEFAGMMQYDGDLFIPPKYLVTPPAIERTMGEYLANEKIGQYAISETQKYGHVTYFWNGNKSGYFDKNYETYVEIKSDVIPFDQAPAMKAVEVTDALIKAIKEDKNQFYRVNYANGDMVGHTGNLKATIQSLETLDKEVGRLIEICNEKDIVLMITADHGNADEMFQLDKKGNAIVKDGIPTPKTSHTLNPVNFVIYDKGKKFKLRTPKQNEKFGLANIAATVIDLLGYETPEDFYPSLLEA